MTQPVRRANKPDQCDYSRVVWNEELWAPTRQSLLRLSVLPKPESEERQWLDSKPTRKMLLEFVQILDGLERLITLADKKTLDENPVLNNWMTSIRGLQRRMVRSLERVGVRPIPSLGRPFDPNIHEAVEVRKDPDLPPATVVEVREKPYRWENKPLRVGKVVVTPRPAVRKNGKD